MSPTFFPTVQRASCARLLGRLRLALTLVLMLALPLQSMAGASMPFCGAAHHGNAAPVVDHAHATQDHHQHSSASVDDGRCSACLTCCGASAVVGGVVALSPAPSVVPVLPRFYRFEGFIADTPERPPRCSLA